MKYHPTGQPSGVGLIELLETTVSYPTGGKVSNIYTGAVTDSVMRMPIISKGMVTIPCQNLPQEEIDAFLAPYRKEYDPNLFVPELVDASVGHNQRTDQGFKVQVFRLFGTVGATTNAAIVGFMAVGNSTAAANPTVDSGAGTLTKTDLSMGVITASVTTNEFVTANASGLARAATTPGNLGSAPSAFDATSTVDLVKTYTVNTTSFVYNAALFDSAVGGTTNLYAEATFGTKASVVSGDSLVVTYTCTF